MSEVIKKFTVLMKLKPEFLNEFELLFVFKVMRKKRIY
jgi:hypothetical protein